VLDGDEMDSSSRACVVRRSWVSCGHISSCQAIKDALPETPAPIEPIRY
jgi:hypothetical protein